MSTKVKSTPREIARYWIDAKFVHYLERLEQRSSGKSIYTRRNAKRTVHNVRKHFNRCIILSITEDQLDPKDGL